jgi:hypothetical protein
MAVAKSTLCKARDMLASNVVIRCSLNASRAIRFRMTRCRRARFRLYGLRQRRRRALSILAASLVSILEEQSLGARQTSYAAAQMVGSCAGMLLAHVTFATAAATIDSRADDVQAGVKEDDERFYPQQAPPGWTEKVTPLFCGGRREPRQVNSRGLKTANSGLHVGRCIAYIGLELVLMEITN